jgi:hypothetical protein
MIIEWLYTYMCVDGSTISILYCTLIVYLYTRCDTCVPFMVNSFDAPDDGLQSPKHGVFLHHI